MHIAFYYLLISFALSVIIVPIMIAISKKFNLYDSTGGRKIHTGNISRLGGVGILLSFTITVVLLNLNKDYFFIKQNIWFLIIAVFLIIIMGIIDDIKNIRARIKLLTQIIAAILVLIGGFKFNKISISTWSLDLGYFSYILTFIWIIGVTNAMNLIDGLDGLAGSLTVIVCATFSVFAFVNKNCSAMLLSLILASSVCGFLIYNLPIPTAKVFMGDGGSQFLGFLLAVLPLVTNDHQSYISLPYAAAVLLIPIFDTFAAIWRRLREHRPVDSPDKFHLHHKLLLLGFSKRVTLIIIIVFQSIISVFLICGLFLGRRSSLILLITVYVMGILFFTIIHLGKVKAINNSSHLD